MKRLKSLFVVFVVSWAAGGTYQTTNCIGKEPEGIVCAKLVQQRKTKEFKSKEAAQEFQATMNDMKAPDVKLDEIKK